MAFWIENYFLCLFVSVVLAGILIPNIITIAFKRKLFDEIDERKIHPVSYTHLTLPTN